MSFDLMEIIPAPSSLAPFVRRFSYGNRTIDEPVPIRPKSTGYIYLSNFFPSNGVWFSYEIEKMGNYVSGRWTMAGQKEDDKIKGVAVDEMRVLFANSLRPGSIACTIRMAMC